MTRAFGEAGWYTHDGAAYDPPSRPFDRPLTRPPVIQVDRRLWISRYNPVKYDDSDVADDDMFPWSRPEDAPYEGWWLSTWNKGRPAANRPAIEEITTGDLVVSSGPIRDPPSALTMTRTKTPFSSESASSG